MKRRLIQLGVIIVPAALCILAVQANAAPMGQAEELAQIKQGFSQHADTYPHASSYYDDLADHYEQDQLMRDTIDQGLESNS